MGFGLSGDLGSGAQEGSEGAQGPLCEGSHG